MAALWQSGKTSAPAAGRQGGAASLPRKACSAAADYLGSHDFIDKTALARWAFAAAATAAHPSLTGNVKFMNFYPFADIDTIAPRPMLFISGDQAHSREFSEKACAQAAEPKELHWVKGAGHMDLYDRTDLIHLPNCRNLQ